MIRKTVLLSLGLALLANPADAGDWNNGAAVLKDSGGMAGVPVPAGRLRPLRRSSCMP